MAAASSQMNTRRRTTVHDLAALRVHRDGSRVANSDSNSSSRRAKYTIRDARGNWVAKDAGGLGTVKQRYAASQPEGEQAEDAGDGSEPERDEEPMEEDVEVEGEDALPKVDKGKGRARESGDEEEEIAVNTRAQKRRRFDEDFSYLNPGAPPTLIPAPDGEDAPAHIADDDPGAFPMPSADLLKCLHYFASTYYSAMGQLYDASREFRKERKIRRAQKLKKTGGSSTNDPASASEEADGTPDNSGEEDLEFTEDEENEEEEDEEGNEGEKTTKSRKRRPRASRHIDKDMYKLFDGSALMVLGMLLQEHVAELLKPNIPEGWQKEFDRAERDRRAAEKRARRAREMWNKRHTAKVEGSEQIEVQSDGEAREGQPQEPVEIIASSSSDGSESGDDE